MGHKIPSKMPSLKPKPSTTTGRMNAIKKIQSHLGGAGKKSSPASPSASKPKPKVAASQGAYRKGMAVNNPRAMSNLRDRAMHKGKMGTYG